MTVEFGFVIPQGANWEALSHFAATAERVGIDHLWAVDHMMDIPADRPLHEGWTVMSMLAAVTRRLRIGHMVLCQSYRNPALLGKMAGTLDSLSGGRLIFGLGAGWFSTEYEMYGYAFPSMGQRLGQLREALEVCKCLWTEEAASFAGKYYRVEDAVCLPKPVQQPHPPIMIGGGGEKVLLRIVAEHADIWNYNLRDLPQFAHKLDVLHAHCNAVGRDPVQITVSQNGTLLLADSEAEAKRLLEVGQALNPLVDAESCFVWGHAQRVIDTIGRHVDLGTQHFIFGDTKMTTAVDLERFAAEVMPHFR